MLLEYKDSVAPQLAQLEGLLSLSPTMHANLPIAVATLVYGLGPVMVLAGGYFAWRRIRSRCRRYSSDHYENRASERKNFWGYE